MLTLVGLQRLKARRPRSPLPGDARRRSRPLRRRAAGGSLRRSRGLASGALARPMASPVRSPSATPRSSTAPVVADSSWRRSPFSSVDIALISGQIFGLDAWPLTLLPMAIVIVVLIDTAVASRRDWHGRWRESRRGRRAPSRRGPILAALGQVRNDAPGDEPAWTGWYAPADLRALGLSSSRSRCRAPCLRSRRRRWLRRGPARLSRQNATLMRAIEARLGSLGRVSFIATFGLAALDIGLGIAGISLPAAWQAVLIGMTAGLPVFGTTSSAFAP